jgi:hypothetical protein
MASAFFRQFLALHMTPEEAKATGDKLLGVLEIMSVQDQSLLLLDRAHAQRERARGRPLGRVLQSLTGSGSSGRSRFPASKPCIHTSHASYASGPLSQSLRPYLPLPWL